MDAMISCNIPVKLCSPLHYILNKRKFYFSVLFLTMINCVLKDFDMMWIILLKVL